MCEQLRRVHSDQRGFAAEALQRPWATTLASLVRKVRQGPSSSVASSSRVKVPYPHTPARSSTAALPEGRGLETLCGSACTEVCKGQEALTVVGTLDKYGSDPSI